MWEELLTEAVTLFVIIDPIGATTIFLALSAKLAARERGWIALKAVIVAACILIAFLIGGRLLLIGMGISITSFQIAGGIVLLVFGLNMVFDFMGGHPSLPGGAGHDIAVYPLAMPAIAGPGTIMTVVLLSDDDRHDFWGQLQTVGVLLLILALTYLMFRLAGLIQRLIGETGASIVKRIMGLLLASVAVDKILSGLGDYFPMASSLVQ
jgi:multiple antibiotic resistance protein